MSNIKKIKIINNGPYLVTGGIPLEELIIKFDGKGQIYEEGRKFNVPSEYHLCRCGSSKNKPFCDGMHNKINFDGTLTASKEPIANHCKRYHGKNLILEDTEKLCAFARFCHYNGTEVWTLTEEASNKEEESLAIKLACDCPAGRLVMKDKKTNEAIEPALEPSIVLLQDPERNCSGPLWVRGGIPIEAPDGFTYEIRNRVTLCRCGVSDNKPFCDANHVSSGFLDKNNN